LRNAVIDQ